MNLFVHNDIELFNILILKWRNGILNHLLLHVCNNRPQESVSVVIYRIDPVDSHRPLIYMFIEIIILLLLLRGRESLSIVVVLPLRLHD